MLTPFHLAPPIEHAALDELPHHHLGLGAGTQFGERLLQRLTTHQKLTQALERRGHSRDILAVLVSVAADRNASGAYV